MKNFLFPIFFLFFFVNFQAQNYLGITTSNYAGVMGNDLNPSSFVDGRFKFDLNLASMSLNAYQNFAYFDTEYMREAQNNVFGRNYWWLKSFRDTTIYNGWGAQPFEQFNNEPFSEGIIKHLYDTLTKSPRGIYMNYQLDLLNFAFHITPKISVGFNAKIRSITNIDNMDPKLAVLAESGLEVSSLWGQKLPEELLNLNHLTWSEYGLNYGQVVKDENEHFLKIGGDLKYMQGYSAAYVYTDNFNYGLVDEDTSFYLKGDFGYGYSDNLAEILTYYSTKNKDSLSQDILNQINQFGLPRPASKSGVGIDLGVVYEWRPKYKKYKFDMDGKTNLWMKNQNKYELRIGASLLDIGALKFTKGGLSRDFSVNVNRKFDLEQFESASSIVDFDQVIDSLINESIDPTEWTSGEKDILSTFWVQTPSALSLQIDYHIWKYFYVNATGMLNLISTKRQAKVKTANQFSITPSFDYAWFGVHLPISVNEYSGFKAGAATRLGPLTIGITDFRTLFVRGKVRGAEVFIGLRLPVLYDAIKDIDNDKVSDELDDCISTPGIWSFNGCPDTDGDGIKDMDDDCATVPGLVEFKGCPDKDGDKIPDKDDDCPEVAGLIEYKGCPDRDGDKVIDKNDDCPEIAGLVEFKGCPDKDGDKIPDKDDDCPEIFGLAEFKGCPDKDGDKIPDKDDDCPEIPGLIELNGCPDRDGDGISDALDACPDVAGTKENQGCPDKDGDGLFDFVDGCPDIAGPKENNGCPWPDTDGDGLLDKDDECPTLKGPKENKGCPYKDSDNDGLLDKDDECPMTPGPKENKGCPIIEEKVVEVIKTAFNNLEFATAKDIILDPSKPALDELALVLQDRPLWKLEISGHTDNVGDDNANLVLSKKRAEALKNYLISKGISAERLKTLYFGETKPIADNSTAEGRKKNRRVEMKIVFE
jgi:outer membrane protein OmpA-like peptidoglycan-associated protein